MNATSPAAIKFFGLLLACFLGWPATRVAAQTGTQHEYELKAGFLYNIIRYVEWPSDALSNNPPAIQIGLLGQIPFADALEVGSTDMGDGTCQTPRRGVEDVVLFLMANSSGRIQGALHQRSELRSRTIFRSHSVCGRLYISVTFLGSPAASFQFSSVHVVYTLVSSTSSTS